MTDAGVFRSLFDAYPDGVLVVDAHGIVRLANPAAAALLGYAAEAMRGLPVDALVPERYAPAHAAHRQGYGRHPRARPMGTDMELKARRADGSEVLVEIALSPATMGGEPVVVASVRGIGVYPRIERALQRAHYSEHVVQVGKLAVDTRDPKVLLGHVPHVVTQAMRTDVAFVCLVEPGGTELTVASRDGPADAEPARQPYCADTPLGHVVSTGRPVIVADYATEQRFAVPAALRASGMVSGLAVPLNDKGKVIGVLATRSRVARAFGPEEVAFLEALSNLLATSLQRTHTEAQLSHSQRMESVGLLTGGIAHDFNNLLTVIQGNLQMLAEQPAIEADAHARQLVNAAARGRRGAELTGKLLAFSRRQALAPAAVDPAAMLESLADMLRRTIGRHIVIEVQTANDCPPCRADPVQLEAALLNIAINARDAMPDGGTLTFSCAAVDADEAGAALAVEPAGGTAPAGPASWVRFAVRDTGTGMAPAVRDRAFEPFFTTKEAGRGTGLGLSTVYGFVRQSGGTVDIASEPGLGTTVSLCLPALRPQAEAATSAMRAARGGRALHVLVVEDDDDVRAVAVAFLKQLGCSWQACADGESALRWLQRERPAPAEGGRTASTADDPAFDLLFSDITLGPGLDGIALAGRAVALRPGLRVLLTSGYSRYLAGGASAQLAWPVLRKPYTQDELAAAIAAATATAAPPGAAPAA